MMAAGDCHAEHATRIPCCNHCWTTAVSSSASLVPWGLTSHNVHSAALQASSQLPGGHQDVHLGQRVGSLTRVWQAPARDVIKGKMARVDTKDAKVLYEGGHVDNPAAAQQSRTRLGNDCQCYCCKPLCTPCKSMVGENEREEGGERCKPFCTPWEREAEREGQRGKEREKAKEHHMMEPATILMVVWLTTTGV